MKYRFILFIFLCSPSLLQAQNLDFIQIKQMLIKPEVCDFTLSKYNYQRTGVQWKYTGYLISSYNSPDNKSKLEISSTEQHVMCTILTSDSNYVAVLFKQGLKSGFIKYKRPLKEQVDKSGVYSLGSLDYKLYNFQVLREQKGLYKIIFSNSFHE